MAKYVLVYKGGITMPASEAEFQAQLADWAAWYGSLGDALVDAGAPFGPSATVSAGGAVREGAPSGLTGYTIIQAEDLAAAGSRANGCPILAGGGSVEIYEIHEIM